MTRVIVVTDCWKRLIFIPVQHDRTSSSEREKNHLEHVREEKKQAPKGMKIIVSKNGPYVVCGRIPLTRQIISTDSKGVPDKWLLDTKYPLVENYALCRCGQSENKPFCDGTHANINFDGTETASRDPYLSQAKDVDGPTLKLTDCEHLCASARFCHRGGEIWSLIPKSDNSEAERIAIEDAADCPSGRLVVWDKKTGKAIEPKLEKSIELIEDPKIGVSGPIWVRGGIPIESADGETYEVRNRVTLCRCGKSSNKPFCDSSHYSE
jgi:CDGSH-type Zn-finger protein